MSEKNLAPEKITNKDIKRAWLRWYTIAEMSNSFERLQSLAFCAALSPILEKLYKTKESLSEALKRHLVFFNTQANWGGIIPGVVIAMEEEKANGADIPDEAINGIKTGLMGAFAGIGDTIDWGTIKPIIIGLCLPLGMNGNPLASILLLGVFTAITATEGYLLFKKGYTLGRDSIINILESGWINQLITGAGVMGMFMMGALSASFVKLKTPLEFNLSSSPEPLAIQALIDNIAPGILPLCVVFGIYAYLQKKGQNYVKLLVYILVASILGSLLGIF